MRLAALGGSEYPGTEMTTHFELYGSRDTNPAGVQESVARAMGIAFEARESTFWGEYFSSGPPGAEHFEVRPNRDVDKEYVEPEFAEFSTLVYVNETSRPKEVMLALSRVDGLTKLREESID